MNISTRTIKDTHEALKRGDFSVAELVSEYKERIEEKNDDINAYLEVYDDLEEQAKNAQKKFNDGTATMLTGIPIALKDNLLLKGKRVSAASKILENYEATYTGTAVQKLHNEGVVFLGRTNMDEFAMGGSTENSAFGITKNPHDEERVPGGSSGGSAAVVAMNGALAALGSDTGGSVRQPASFCGCVGLKPTYGAVSRHGVIAMGSSLDQIGPLAKTVEDVEVIFNSIRGKDPLDSTSIDKSETKEKKEPKIVGVPRDIITHEGVDEEVKKNFEKSLSRLEEKGYKIKDIELPAVEYALSAYYIIMPAEVSSNLARFDGVRYGVRKEGENLFETYTKTRGEGFGEEVRRRIMLGTYVLSSGYYDAYYNEATEARKKITREFKEAFQDVDVIATPTTPTSAFKVGEKAHDPLAMYLSDIFTVPANIVGVPALSIPAGCIKKDQSQLPLGLHLMASHKREDVLFKVGKEFSKD